MHFLPLEIYLTLIPIIPLSLCFARWKFSLTWKQTFLMAATCSWLYFNYWLIEFAPFHDGPTQAAYLLGSWFGLLPILTIFAPIFHFMGSVLSPTSIKKYSTLGFLGTLVFSLLALLWSHFGWINEAEAIECARTQLIQHGHTPKGPEIAQFCDGNWVVHYPETKFQSIGLSNNGRVRWISFP